MPYIIKIHELQDPEFRRAQADRMIRNAFVIGFIEPMMADNPELEDFDFGF